MANYTPIPFSKEAEQLVVPDVDPSDGDVTGQVTVQSLPFQIYRDTQGFYTLVPTAQGQRRGNVTDWIMLEQAIIPAIPATPGVPGVQATGSISVAGIAAGDGLVGFNYNGIIYATSPPASQDAATTAQVLVNLVNLGGQGTAVLNVDVVEITSINTGVTENITLLDVTTDTVQTGTPAGMSGGVDTIPAVPETPEQPAVFSVWTDAVFTSTFQVV
jgi:hypothetical protein